MKRLILLCVLMLLSLSLSVGAKDFQVDLQWNAVTVNSDGSPCADLTGYRIYRSESSGSGYVQVGAVGLTTSFTDNFSVPDSQVKSFYYVVTAIDQTQLESTYSNEVSDVFDGNVPPGSPSNVIITIKIVNIKIDANGNVKVVQK